jgi:uncharacterized membrane protein
MEPTAENDMRKSDAKIASAIAGMLALTIAGSTAAQRQPLVHCAEQERCYGVSKTGKNDCSTAQSACSGTSKEDYQKDAWVYVPKGTCIKLAGGSLKSPTAKK